MTADGPVNLSAGIPRTADEVEAWIAPAEPPDPRGRTPLRRAFTTRPTLSGTFGMAASTHWLATASAQAVLERGGNAFDAVVAGAFVLHVVEPHLNGPGGDLVGIFATADDPAPTVLMGQGPAPAGATIEHFRAEGLDLVPGAGGLAAAVPGRRRRVAAAAARPRHVGARATCSPTPSATPATDTRSARPRRPRSPASRSLFTRGLDDLGRAVDAGRRAAGRRHRRAQSRLRRRARRSRPRVVHRPRRRTGRPRRAHRRRAARVEDRARRAGGRRVPRRSRTGTPTAAATPACITAEDFASFDAGYEPAVTREFRGRTIAKAGAWTQGPAILQTLGMLEPLADELLDPSHEAGAHTILEAQKLALADRDAWFGDDDVDLDALLSDDYLDERRSLIGADGIARVPARRARRARRVPPAAAHDRRRPPRRRRRRADRREVRRDPRRHVPHRRRRPLGQHRLGHARPAAGCSPRRRSPRSGSASAPACR